MVTIKKVDLECDYRIPINSCITDCRQVAKYIGDEVGSIFMLRDGVRVEIKKGMTEEDIYTEYINKRNNLRRGIK